jgi:hypothetical protein
MQIWAQAVMEKRVVKVRELRNTGSRGYWSPTPVPAVTRACQESRKYCSYQKAFMGDESPRCIWTCFANDIVQMSSSLMIQLTKEDSLEKKEIRHLRLELISNGWDMSEFFYHEDAGHVRGFPELERCDVLVNDGLNSWGDFIKDMYWGACPKSNVRFVDAKTGDWIDVESDGPYQDYRDNYIGIDLGEPTVYTRIDDDWDEEDEEDVRKRHEAMMRIKREGLPRINLHY